MSAPTEFRMLDAIIIVLFFVATAAMGWWFSRRPQTTDNYFLGGNKLPAWAIGLSMLATSISSVTFIALPAAAYSLDWRLLVPNLANPIVAIFAIVVLVPFFRKAARLSAFEYLERRFGHAARLYAAFMFLVMQVVRLGSILYLMAIPLTFLTGIDPLWIMIVTGGLVALYTIYGGMEAVIWSDVVQGVILYVGGAAALYCMVQGIEGGLVGMFKSAAAQDKFGLGPMHWATADRTFWALLIVGITNWTQAFTADQNVVQRYLAAKTEKEARQATALCTYLSLPTWAFFFLLGTALYVFYQQNPDPAVVGMSADSVMPYFILNQMPDGLSGLVIAGVLSAAMSSLSSSLNAFATISTADFLRPHFAPGRTDAFYARSARQLTVLATVLMFGAAYWFLNAPKESFNDLLLQVVSLIGGVVVGFFVLGFFAPIVHRRPLWQAFALAISLNVYLFLVQLGVVPNVLPFTLNPILVMPLVNGVMILLAIGLSLLQRSTTHDVAGLTLFTTKQALSRPLEGAAPSH
jgi:solute:Na+ symporter, SSS family